MRGVLLQPLNAPCEVLRALAYLDPESFPVLLDSAAIGPCGRYSILAAFPEEEIRTASGGRQGFLPVFEAAWARAQATPSGPGGGTGSASAAREPSLPFRGGWMLFVGYECASEIEPTLSLPQGRSTAPAAFALRVPAALIYDHLRRRGWMLAEPGRAELLAALQAAIARLPQPLASPLPPGARAADWQLSEEPAERYRERVTRALEHIAAGEVYQVNLSRPWHAAASAGCPQGAAAILYERLRRSNPAPFAALVQRPGWTLLSSSPERLIRIEGDRVTTRPIAGTRARMAAGREQAEVDALIAHPKERAEHVMLIDLERSDLGRLCRAGSVQVDEFMITESYAHVHHLVSNVRGRLRAGLTPADVLRAVFPGGTITGCPKVRCMQLIAELEGGPRGAYTGALGYVNHDGSMDLNILIRSMQLQGGALELRTGAGIVADSDPQRELEETRAKARGLLLALQPETEGCA